MIIVLNFTKKKLGTPQIKPHLVTITTVIYDFENTNFESQFLYYGEILLNVYYRNVAIFLKKICMRSCFEKNLKGKV